MDKMSERVKRQGEKVQRYQDSAKKNLAAAVASTANDIGLRDGKLKNLDDRLQSLTSNCKKETCQNEAKFHELSLNESKVQQEIQTLKADLQTCKIDAKSADAKVINLREDIENQLNEIKKKSLEQKSSSEDKISKMNEACKYRCEQLELSNNKKIVEAVGGDDVKGVSQAIEDLKNKVEQANQDSKDLQHHTNRILQCNSEMHLKSEESEKNHLQQRIALWIIGAGVLVLCLLMLMLHLRKADGDIANRRDLSRVGLQGPTCQRDQVYCQDEYSRAADREPQLFVTHHRNNYRDDPINVV
jgi:chromosome segregation ATPase